MDSGRWKQRASSTRISAHLLFLSACAHFWTCGTDRQLLVAPPVLLLKDNRTTVPCAILSAPKQCNAAEARIDNKCAGKRSRHRGAEEQRAKAGRMDQKSQAKLLLSAMPTVPDTAICSGHKSDAPICTNTRYQCRTTSRADDDVSDASGSCTSEGYEKVIE